MTQEVERNEKGQFIGSGNPAGRPKTARGKINQLQENLEIAVREGVSTRDVQAIIDELVSEAKQGNLKAAKLLLDKFIPNASKGEDTEAGRQGITIVVKNATIGNQEKTVIDGDYTTPEDTDG